MRAVPFICCYLYFLYATPIINAQNASLSKRLVEKPVQQIDIDNTDAKVRALIEKLVYSNEPTTPQDTKLLATDDREAQKQNYASVQKPFRELSELKEIGIPFLVQHLKDNRPSIPFRNHYSGVSVGHACYWNIYYQLQDTPVDYSEYGYSRKGRDGADHAKPYWTRSPFDGGLELWLEENKGLSYVQEHIKCLQWFLDEEKRIGVPDAESYYVNILPLEIQILKRRLENGEPVRIEFERLMEVRDKKLNDQIPPELFPVAASTGITKLNSQRPTKSDSASLATKEEWSAEQAKQLCESASASFSIHFNEVTFYDREPKDSIKLETMESIRERLENVAEETGIRIMVLVLNQMVLNEKVLVHAIVSNLRVRVPQQAAYEYKHSGRAGHFHFVDTGDP